MNIQDLLTTCKIQKDNYPEEWGNCGELLINEFERLKSEVELAKQRLGPAGWKMLQDISKLRAVADAAKKLYAWPISHSKEFFDLTRALKALSEDGTPL